MGKHVLALLLLRVHCYSNQSDKHRIVDKNKLGKQRPEIAKLALQGWQIQTPWRKASLVMQDTMYNCCTVLISDLTH